MNMVISKEQGLGRTRNVLWWTLFIFFGILLQRLVPGVDFLVAGLLCILREKRYKDLFWLLPLLVVLQEGMGTQAFGVALLWYAAASALFFLGRWLFDVDNFFYAFLLSACLGICYFGIIFLMSPLYDVSLDVARLMDESVYQSLLLPPAWRLAQRTRRLAYTDDAAYEDN